jgi:hypothetical protein
MFYEKTKLICSKCLWKWANRIKISRKNKEFRIGVGFSRLCFDLILKGIREFWESTKNKKTY